MSDELGFGKNPNIQTNKKHLLKHFMYIVHTEIKGTHTGTVKMTYFKDQLQSLAAIIRLIRQCDMLC